MAGADIVARARAFAREEVVPRAGAWERERRTCEATLRLAAREGFAGLLLPERLGGLGLSVLTAAQVFEEVAAAHLPFAFSLVVHANLVRAIGRLGTTAQVDRLLPGMLRGDTIGAFCLTEPGAGSDAAAIVTRAARVGDAWHVTGDKAWVTNGVFADIASVYAQTDAALGWRGIVALLVPLAGVGRVSGAMLLGGHAMGVSGLSVDARVGDDAVLAPAGEGFRAAMAGIDLARVLLSAMCCGIVRDSLENAVEYARRRHAFGRPIAEFQGLQWTLADVATDLAAARALTHEAARTLDAGADSAVPAAHAKKFATRAALAGVTACMRAMGAAALAEDSPVARHLASAQIAEYLDGTSGIQNVVIARRLFRG